MSDIEISTDPQEVLSRVDEMLAWMRVAGEGDGGHSFIQDGYRKAQPLVDLGGGQTGVMTPSTVAASGASVEAESVYLAADSMAQSVHRLGASWLAGGMGARPCFGTIAESVGRELAILRHGDDVDDLRDKGAYEGARYRLEGALLVTGDEASTVRRRLRFPRTASVVAYQTLCVFNDGRSASGMDFLGHDKQVGWMDFDGQVIPPVGINRGGSFGQILVANVVRLWIRQHRRQQRWVVELSASQARTGVGLETDAVGAAALVREARGSDRDPKRVVHWVSEHMRRRRNGDETAVRAHLRGQQTFRVGPYWATVYPSRRDLTMACNGARFDVEAHQ